MIEGTEKFKEAFNLYDVDQDGHITKTELMTVLGHLGKTITEEEAATMISDADTDKDGTINYAEFCELMQRRLGELGEPEGPTLKEAFQIFDKNGDGYIDKDELKSVLRALNQSDDEASVNALMDEADKNKDGLISFDEFTAIMGETDD